MSAEFVSNINTNCAAWGTSKVDDGRQIITHSALDDDATDKDHVSKQMSAQQSYAMKRMFTGHFGRFTTYDVYTGVSDPKNEAIVDKLIKRSHSANPDSKEKAFQMGPDTLVIANF